MLYDSFSGLVMGVCLRYAKNPDEAEDIFQEAFIKIFENLNQVSTPEALPGWIRRLTINTALDELKVKKFHWLVPNEINDLDDNQYSDLLDHLTNEQIIKIINELPEGYRAVFNLNIIDGYSHREIGKKLGITESTSRSQLTYAKRLLQQRLKKLGITRYESVI